MLSARKMGTAWISGEDVLDMAAIHDDGFPLPGKIALPNMIKVQFDQLSTLIMTDLQRSLIHSFQQLLQYSEPRNWEVLFIALAVLGNLVSRMGQDNARRAKEANAEVGLRACTKSQLFSADTSSRADTWIPRRLRWQRPV